jgi:hypothetical protein
VDLLNRRGLAGTGSSAGSWIHLIASAVDCR